MLRVTTITVIALTCSLAGFVNAGAQPATAEAVLTLKGGVELRGQFVSFKDGQFTIRLPDGRTVGYPTAQVDQLQLAEAAPSTAGSMRPLSAPAGAPNLPDVAATAALEAKACGPAGIKFAAFTDKSQRPTPAVPADKGLVYVVRPTMAGDRIQTRLGIDGSWVGVTRGNSYFSLTLDPGEHYLCSQADDRSVGSLKVEAGKTYYLQQKLSTGMMKSRTTLQVVSEQEGRDALSKASPSTWRQVK